MARPDPIFPGAERHPFDGRFPCNVELAPDSTLAEEDIELIGKAASWEVAPSSFAARSPVGRSILLPREKRIRPGRVPYTHLQVTGIGYAEFDYDPTTELGVGATSDFQPPSAENFLASHDIRMGTTLYDDGERVQVDTDTSYLPSGTYTRDGLAEKTEKTRRVAENDWRAFEVPGVEAVGLYDDPDLNKDGEPFGFLVLQAPETPRFMQNIHSHYRSATGGDLSVGIYDVWGFLDWHVETMQPVVTALRELHDVGYAHLQLHGQNFHLVNGVPVLADWETLHELDDSEEDNALNRACDLVRLVGDFERLLRGVVPDYNPQEAARSMPEYANRIAAAYLNTDQIDLPLEAQEDPHEVFPRAIAEVLLERGI